MDRETLEEKLKDAKEKIQNGLNLAYVATDFAIHEAKRRIGHKYRAQKKKFGDFYKKVTMK